MAARLSLILTCIFLTLCTINATKDWWENSNIYQIYPRSYKDSDGDGIGDLNGINQNLQYLKDIGMDAVWLSPIFASPMIDFGYDISDYTKVQPEYGSNEDLFALIEKAHSIGLRLILDFVPNHTSDEHEWFQRSVQRDPEYKDYYIWHDGVVNASTGERQPPSNWISEFRHSAWQWHEERQQYYLHQFGVKQPDLNYRNPAVQQALKDVLKYWLSHGIDGFRIDAVPYFFEADIDPSTGTYPDEPLADDLSSCTDPNDRCYLKHIYTFDHPQNVEIIYDWHDLLEDWKRAHKSETKILLTESYSSFDVLMETYGNGKRNGSQVPFNFEMLPALTADSTAQDYLYYIQHWLTNMPEDVNANWVLGNHDRGRVGSRLGAQRIDLINILLQTLPGIAITYYGEEYGMLNVHISWEDTIDALGCAASPSTYENFSRDPVRTPFRWNNSTNAGFSTAATTWLPVGNGYETQNVEAQLAAANSHLKIFKNLTSLRKLAAFQDGTFEPKVVGNVLIYKRQAANGDAFIVVLNIGGSNTVLNLQQLFALDESDVEVLVSSLQSGLKNGQILDGSSFVAKAYNGYVVRVLN